MQSEFIKVADVAKLLQMSPKQITNLCRENAVNRLPHMRPNGRTLRFKRSDIENWFSKNTVAALR
jgi:excisionase family DNA binding protein